MTSSPRVLDVASLLRWALQHELTEAVLIGRDGDGKLRLVSTHGTLPSIFGLMDAARDDLDTSIRIAGITEKTA